MDDLGAHRAYLEGPTFSRRTAALGPEFLLDYYVPKKKSERDSSRLRHKGRTECVLSPLELQIYVPHGTRPGR